MSGLDLSQLLLAASYAYSAAEYGKASEIYERAELLAREQGDVVNLCSALLLRGSSLEMMSRYDEAFVPLLEAAHLDGFGINPADTFMAQIVATEIAITCKPRKLCENLLAEAEDLLTKLNRSEWKHTIFFLKSKLLSARGKHSEALAPAWEALRLIKKNSNYPAFSTWTYQHRVAFACFRVRDLRGLSQLSAKAPKVKTTFCRVFNVEAECYLERVTRPRSELAPSLFDAARDGLSVDANRTELIRILGLTLRLDHARDVLRRTISASTNERLFAEGLLAVDLDLMELRATLSLPFVDDEVEVDKLPKVVMGSSADKVLVDRIYASYENLMQFAEMEDMRLETDYYTTILAERQRRVTNIASCLSVEL